jgi:hypothetical protein
MPIGIYKHKPLSEQHKKRISDSEKGKKLSTETKKKMTYSHIINDGVS